MQPGDVEKTYASTEALQEAIHYTATTPLDSGVKKFVDWYIEYSPKGKL
jgi:UDP-glucuronate 4-epimerase